MESNPTLQSKFEELLGTRNVYEDPPESVKMKYTAIKYSKTGENVRFANNGRYIRRNRYEVIVIAHELDDPVIEKLLVLPYCSWERHYVSNNLHHDVLTLYH